VNTLYCLEEWRGEQRISPPGDNFTPRGQPIMGKTNQQFHDTAFEAKNYVFGLKKV
jgi:hypothetical protein